MLGTCYLVGYQFLHSWPHFLLKVIRLGQTWLTLPPSSLGFVMREICWNMLFMAVESKFLKKKLEKTECVHTLKGSWRCHFFKTPEDGLPSGKLTWLWKLTIFNRKIRYKCPFSGAMLVITILPPCRNLGLPTARSTWLCSSSLALDDSRRLTGCQKSMMNVVPSGKLTQLLKMVIDI